MTEVPAVTGTDSICDILNSHQAILELWFSVSLPLYAVYVDAQYA